MSDLTIDDVLRALEGFDPVLSLKAARATELSTATLRRRVQSGELQAMKTRPRRGVLVRPDGTGDQKHR